MPGASSSAWRHGCSDRDLHSLCRTSTATFTSSHREATMLRKQQSVLDRGLPYLWQSSKVMSWLFLCRAIPPRKLPSPSRLDLLRAIVFIRQDASTLSIHNFTHYSSITHSPLHTSYFPYLLTLSFLLRSDPVLRLKIPGNVDDDDALVAAE